MKKPQKFLQHFSRFPNQFTYSARAVKKGNTGFTLIEVLIVLAMVAILTAIAYPSYIEQIRRGVLPEAGSLLLEGKISMDQFYATKRNFSTSTATGGPCTNKTGKYFTLSCALDGANPLNYTLTATGIVGTRAAGFSYKIDQRGTRSMQTVGAGNGWATSANCWLFKKGESC